MLLTVLHKLFRAHSYPWAQSHCCTKSSLLRYWIQPILLLIPWLKYWLESLEKHARRNDAQDCRTARLLQRHQYIKQEHSKTALWFQTIHAYGLLHKHNAAGRRSWPISRCAISHFLLRVVTKHLTRSKGIGKLWNNRYLILCACIYSRLSYVE